MDRTVDGRFWLAQRAEAPPHWAVIAVKCCVIGILLLPVSTLAWALFYYPTMESDLGPLAFGLTVGLGVAMLLCATILTRTYPPVPRGR